MLFSPILTLFYTVVHFVHEIVTVNAASPRTKDIFAILIGQRQTVLFCLFFKESCQPLLGRRFVIQQALHNHKCAAQ